MVGWLSVLFVAGNLVFTNLLVRTMGFVGLPLGIVASGALTVAALLAWQRSRRTA